MQEDTLSQSEMLHLEVEEPLQSRKSRKSHRMKVKVEDENIKALFVPNEHNSYSLRYAIYCLLLISFSSMSMLWSRTVISAFYGYATYGKTYDPEYSMQMNLEYGLQAKTYASLSTVYPAILQILFSLFGGRFVEKYPMKTVIGVCTIGWGLATALMGLTTNVW
jgi:MFS family permease